MGDGEVRRGLRPFQSSAQSRKRDAQRRGRRLRCKTLRGAIQNAALSLYQGSMHSHQRRIGHKRCRAAASVHKQNVSVLSRVETFEQLYQTMEKAIGGMKEIGPLSCYDVAHRIGISRKISPTEVYLHAATLDGAKKVGATIGKLTKIPMSDLPRVLRSPTAEEAEDFLRHCSSGRFGGDCAGRRLKGACW